MQFQVPQFIEVEDKIFGPLTLKQFIYLVGGAGIVFALYTFLPFFLVLIVGAPVAALAVGLAFYKVNNRPLVDVIESAVSYFFSHRLYVWKKGEKQAVGAAAEAPAAPSLVPKLSESKLKDLAWSLDIQESVYSSRKQQK